MPFTRLSFTEHDAGAGVNSSVVTPAAINVGDLLISLVEVDLTTGNSTATTDSLNNVYSTAVAGTSWGPSGFDHAAVYYSVAIAGGANPTVTTHSSTNSRTFFSNGLIRYSGGAAATSMALNQKSSTTAASGTTFGSGNISCSDNALLIGWSDTNDGAETVTGTGGAWSANISGGSVFSFVSEQLNAVNGTYSFDGTYGSTSTNISIILSFNAAADGLRVVVGGASRGIMRGVGR